MENKIILGDFFQVVREIPDESIDLILTDPPYDSLNRWKGVGTTGRMGRGKIGTKADDPSKFFRTIKNNQLPELMFQLYRILKSNCHCYVMCDHVTLPYFYNIIGLGFDCSSCIYEKEKVPFDNLKPLIWNKVAIGMGYHYRSSYEFILMFDKGKRKLNNLSISDVLEFKRIKGEVPTAKPLELFELLITQSTNEGELVFDPFLGSGTTAVACINTNRKYIGIEIDENNYKIAEKRINSISYQKSLFEEIGGKYA